MMEKKDRLEVLSLLNPGRSGFSPTSSIRSTSGRTLTAADVAAALSGCDEQTMLYVDIFRGAVVLDSIEYREFQVTALGMFFAESSCDEFDNVTWGKAKRILTAVVKTDIGHHWCSECNGTGWAYGVQCDACGGVGHDVSGRALAKMVGVKHQNLTKGQTMRIFSELRDIILAYKAGIRRALNKNL